MSFCLRPNVCKKCGKPLTMFEGWICLECEKAEQVDKIIEIIEPLRHLSIDEMSNIEWQILKVIDGDKALEQEPNCPFYKIDEDGHGLCKNHRVLEQEPSGDLISRQAVDTLVDELARAISDERCCMSRGRSTATIMQDILDLPSVNPQEPKTDVLDKIKTEIREHCERYMDGDIIADEVIQAVENIGKAERS